MAAAKMMMAQDTDWMRGLVRIQMASSNRKAAPDLKLEAAPGR
jgi:hypothetical protein